MLSSEKIKEKSNGKNGRNLNEYSKPLISSTDIKSALRNYLNTELEKKNNSDLKLKSDCEDRGFRDSNEKSKNNNNMKNKNISSYSDVNEKLIPNNENKKDLKNEKKIDVNNNLLNSKIFTSADRELLDRIRIQEGKGGYVKNKLRR